MRLAGRTAIVTGAASGAAQAICREFSRQGGRIVAADSDAAVEDFVESLRSAGADATFSRCDVGDEDSVQALVGDAVMAFGGVDVLVNAAVDRAEGDALSVTREEWARAFGVGVEGAWLCARYALPFLKSSGRAAIVNVVGTDAERTMPRRFLPAAACSAVVGMTRSMAVDFGLAGVRVNALLLGCIQTPRLERRLAEASDPEEAFRRMLAAHPLGRLGTPAEAARAAAFLASDDASFVTGSTLVVDGGRSCVIQELRDWT
ncbi:MAG TPA: SDR family oxidoreductase [Planctomycetota bacterium]|nr:SDR family oxidoreductase [Planctomycetota bacterium]